MITNAIIIMTKKLMRSPFRVLSGQAVICGFPAFIIAIGKEKCNLTYTFSDGYDKMGVADIWKKDRHRT